VLPHEDNTAIVASLTKLTSRSPILMTKLGRMLYLLDTNDIRICPRYIRSSANIWAVNLSREVDKDDYQPKLCPFDYLLCTWGSHSIDRFVSKENAQLPTTRDDETPSARTSIAYTSQRLYDASWCMGIMFFQNHPYMASRQQLIPRIAASGTLFNPLPCQSWHGYGATSAHRVEVEVGADGSASAPPSRAAAVAPPAGEAYFNYHCHRFFLEATPQRSPNLASS
jgi:hypothetical protein